MSKKTPDQMEEAKKTVCKKILAALMLNGTNGQKYGELKRSMAENYATGTREYPRVQRWCFASSQPTSHLQDGTSVGYGAS
jgi:hypothetical protein